VLSNQELVKQISDEGHSIGNHTYYHNATFPMSCKNKITEEIKKTNQLLEQITSKKIIFFRPPFGITNPNINIVLKKLHLKSIGWGIRSLDTVTNNSIKLYNKVKKGIDKGESIILFHDRCESTLSILENIIIYCHEKGLKFKTINNA
jgi:peptidoglycan/xylan/chitin deacetylase (PgdA/CDA1 family)